MVSGSPGRKRETPAALSADAGRSASRAARKVRVPAADRLRPAALR